MDVKLQISH